MFDKFSFSIYDGQIEFGSDSGDIFLLGEHSTDILNISPEEYSRMRELSNQISAGDSDAVEELRALLLRYRLFQLVFPPGIKWPAEKYRQIVGDIYAFNQTMFWFIDRFLMHLKKLDAENYAAAHFDFYDHPGLDKMMVNHLRDGALAFYPFDTIDVRFMPRKMSNQPDNYAIYEVYTVDTLQAFLKMDFMKAIMAGHIIRRCKNCRRFFLLTKGYHTEYCDRPLADNPSRNCRNQSAKNTAKEKAANNPIINSYNRAYQRVTADKQRGRISVEEWIKVKQAIRDLKDMAISGKYTDRELDDLLQPEKLYASMNIQRRGGR